jgi:uncharacterized membrane protein YphA (DoxX/SURF4 family)
LSAPTPQVPRPRIQGLSDLIFGLALSIGAIQFIGHPPPDVSQLTGDIAEFAFTFLILINVWNRYTSTTSVMPVETPFMIRLNMLLLFLVAIEPFLFGVLFVPGLSTSVGAAASTYYALDIGGMNIVLAYFVHLLASEERKLIPRELMERYRVVRNSLILGAAIFLASAFPVFWGIVYSGVPLRIYLWIASLPAFLLPRFLRSLRPGALGR